LLLSYGKFLLICSLTQGVRGRRRVLYSPPMKRATIPPAVAPKPAAAPANQTKPRTNSSPIGSPKLIRGNRATVLRQANATAKKESRSVSPRLAASASTSPRSLLNDSVGSSSLGSPRTSVGTASSVGSARSSRNSPRGLTDLSRHQSPAAAVVQDSLKTTPGLVRQGTFTKDDQQGPSPSGRNSSSRSNGKLAKPPSSVSGIPRHSPIGGPAAQPLTVRQASSASLRSAAASGRTPPKVPPKPSGGLFPRRSDTVQPCPAPKPLVSTTKTQALREEHSAALARGGLLRSSNSSTSSKASSGISRNSIRTSSSSQSLRNAAAGIDDASSPPKRIPSSSDIERRKTSLQSVGQGRPQSPDHQLAVRSTSAGVSRALSPPSRPIAEGGPKAPPPKKDVTSKIASLWKKVEESKQKQQQMSKKEVAKDKRVWISRGGKPQESNQERQASPPPAGRLIRSGTYEKLNMDDQVMTSAAALSKELKPRSRSRLSIKLSKFGLSSSKKKGEDTANGNCQSAGSPDTDELGNNSYPVLSSPGSSHVESPMDNRGDFADSVGAVSNHEQRTTATHPFRSSSASSSRGSLAAAVVAPFNYTPSSSSTGTAHDVERIKSAAQIKRNSSYVSSMGRKREEGGDVSPSEEMDPHQQQHHHHTMEEGRRARKTMTSSGQLTLGAYTGNTSSSVVTLV
jgi:hypothetical protein